MPSKIHKELASLSVLITRMLRDIDTEASPTEIWRSIPGKKQYQAFAKAKNTRVWQIASTTYLTSALADRTKQLEKKYKVTLEVPEDYFDNHEDNFVDMTTQTDINKLKAWCFGQAGYLAGIPLLLQPNLAYITDQRGRRADAIQQTETLRVENAGGQVIMEQAFSQNRWNTMRDDRVRPEHQENEGVVVDIGDEFPSGETYPGENSYNCRCWLTYLR